MNFDNVKYLIDADVQPVKFISYTVSVTVELARVKYVRNFVRFAYKPGV